MFTDFISDAQGRINFSLNKSSDRNGLESDVEKKNSFGADGLAPKNLDAL